MTRALVLGLLLFIGVGGDHRPRAELGFLAELPHALVSADPRRGEFVIELPAVDLHTGVGHEGHRQPPVSVAEVPVGMTVYGLRLEVVDAAGRLLPSELVHHFNLIDPAHRELFLPISRRVAAAGKETKPVRLSPVLFGLPLARGDRLVASALLHNPTGEMFHGVRTRLVLLYTPEARPWPLFRVYPWQLDVAFPVGDKSFDLPPGGSTKSYEGSPAVPGTIVALGGHLHEYGTRIELADATTGAVIWRAAPFTDATGRVVGVPVGRLFGWTRLGAHVEPGHRYRVTVEYDNPTGRALKAGGMGVVGGLFIPDRGVTWPAADTSAVLYRQDVLHYLRRVGSGGLEHSGH